MKGAVSMKMMSSTIMMSTSDVTLMSARFEYGVRFIMVDRLVRGSGARGPRGRTRRARGTACARHHRTIEHARDEPIQLGFLAAYRASEGVVGEERRDGGGQTGNGGDEGFCDAGAHDFERGRALDTHAQETVHDPPHRPEQAEKRGTCGGRGEQVQVALHLPDLGDGAALESGLQE